MREETPEQNRPLRSGYTTGACATATSLAAAMDLLGLSVVDRVCITLPRGQEVEFDVFGLSRAVEGAVEVSTLKDAGDDPDVTHGARVFARVGLSDQPGVRFQAAEGVGTVTRTGLSLAPGEPAINPVPRQMISEHLQQLADEVGYQGGFEVAIGIEGGAELALKTLNPRLGIEGGLSILGTTGIVKPYSCSAYIASIHRAIDVARANQLDHLVACTGSVSEKKAMSEYALNEMAYIEMGDFVGAVLTYVRRHPVARLSLVGGFGKFCKLAAGHMDLHSRKSAIDMAWLAGLAGDQTLETCTTSLALLGRVPGLGNRITELALAVVAQRLARDDVPDIELDLVAVDRAGRIVGQSHGSTHDSNDQGIRPSLDAS